MTVEATPLSLRSAARRHAAEFRQRYEIPYYAGPWPNNPEGYYTGPVWDYDYRYLGMHGWAKCHRRAMWRHEEWGCAETYTGKWV